MFKDHNSRTLDSLCDSGPYHQLPGSLKGVSLGEICPDIRVTFESDVRNYVSQTLHYLWFSEYTVFHISEQYTCFPSLSNIVDPFVHLMKSCYHLKPSSLVLPFGKLFLIFFFYKTPVEWRPLLLLLSHSIIVTYSQDCLPFHILSSIRTSSGS